MSKTFTGKVVSDRMEKTVVVEIKHRKPHPQYKKVVEKRSKIYAHDEKGAKVGDVVKVEETRPLSKLKRFKVVEIK
jgi:small subunit ribosomal protein S17